MKINLISFGIAKKLKLSHPLAKNIALHCPQGLEVEKATIKCGGNLLGRTAVVRPEAWSEWANLNVHKGCYIFNENPYFTIS